MKLILVQLKSILFQLRLKDKHCGDEFVHEFEDGTKRMEQYIKVRIMVGISSKAWGARLERTEP